MTLEIREARPDEHDEAGRVAMAAYAEFFAPGGVDEDHPYLLEIGKVSERAPRTTILVALLDGRIVGCVTLEIEGRTSPEDPPLGPDRAHIRMLGVLPNARGRGVGRALMEDCESRAAVAGKAVMTLHTTHLMEAAQEMYGSLGHERVEDEVLPDGFVLLGYRKALQPSTS